MHFSGALTHKPLAGVAALACLLLVAAPSLQCQNIRTIILNIPKINVSNPSASTDGDLITPEHSVGFEGAGASRIENFEETLRLTKTLEKYVAFNPNADSLYPCALVQGKSLPDGVLNPIKVPRNTATITITDFISSNPTSTYSQRVQNPSLETVTLATTRILNQTLQPNQPSKMSYSETDMSSVEEGLLKLGASYKWLSGSVSGNFTTNAKKSKTTMMIRFVQSYYTISCEPPSAPDSFISHHAQPSDFSNYVGPQNPPAYVASVTYGRELWMLIQSDHDSSDVMSSLSAAFNFGVSGGHVDMDAEQKKVLNESSIQTMILGGNGHTAIEALTADQAHSVQEYLLAGADFSRSSPGVIISYTVRYLLDNDVARVSSSTDYVIRTSKANPAAVPVTSATVTWKTNGDGKDWNTQPVVDVVDATGRTVAHVDCCSADRNGDKWDNGHSATANLRVLVPSLTMENLVHGHFAAKRNAVGHDDWDYTAIVEFIFADGTSKQYSCSGRNSCGTNW
jgi:hypothetical protein